jgi:hypothetical protein
MKRIVALGLVCALLVSASGCGGSDVLMKELIASANAYAETIEKKESGDRQSAARDRVLNTREKIEKLPNFAEDKQKLQARYESDLKTAKERLDAALKNLVLENGTPQPNPLDGFLK